jgi:Zn-dependent protease with chaperone function
MKKVEYIADKYAIENGCNKNDLVQALNKINDLNKVEGNKVTITYDLHPRLEKRIKRIKNY